MPQAVSSPAAPEVDEFAAGLEEQVIAAGQQPVATVAPQAPAVDPVMARLREEFEGLDENEDLPAFLDRVTQMQADANEAKLLREKIATYEAAMATQGAQQLATPAAPVVAPAQEAVAAQIQQATRRYEAIKLSAEDEPWLNEKFAKVDPATGLFEPLTPMPQVYRAVEKKNQALLRQRDIINNLTTDFYGSFDEGLTHSSWAKSRDEKIAALEAKIEAQFVPLQKSAQELDFERFQYQNQNVLYQPDPANPTGAMIPTEAGKLFHALTTDAGLPRDKALEIAKEFAAQAAPPAAPATPPAPAKPKAPPARFATPILRRAATVPAERRPVNTAQQPVGRGFKPSWEEIVETAASQAD